MDQCFHELGIAASAIDSLFNGDYLRIDGGLFDEVDDWFE